MKTRNFFALLLGGIMMTACSEQYQVQGATDVELLNGKKLYLKAYIDDDLKDIDSCEVIHGKFSFNGCLDSTIMVYLFAGEECLMPFVIGNEELTIHINDREQRVTGSALNDTLYQFVKDKTAIDAEIAELPRMESALIMDGIDEDVIMVRMNDAAQALAQKNDELVTSFIEKNYDNVLGAGVFMILTNEYPYPILTPQLEAIFAKATPFFMNNAYVRNYIKAAKANMKELGYSGYDSEPQDNDKADDATASESVDDILKEVSQEE